MIFLSDLCSLYSQLLVLYISHFWFSVSVYLVRAQAVPMQRSDKDTQTPRNKFARSVGLSLYRSLLDSAYPLPFHS